MPVPEWFFSAFETVRNIFIGVNILLFAGLLYALIKQSEFRTKFDLEPRPTKKPLTLGRALFRERWEKIVKKIDIGSPEALRLAIIEADALVDEALKQLGLPGEHMADRMARLVKEETAGLDELWRAHRLRNDLVHTAGFPISASDAQAALEDYKAFLKGIEAL